MADDFDMELPAEEPEEMDLDLEDDADSDPSLKVGEEKEIGKSGLKKKLVKEGEKWDTPENGDEVEGQVIKGWDIGIKTMKKGENAVFTIPSELAYGETVKYEARLEDGTVVGRSDGAEFTVKEDGFGETGRPVSDGMQAAIPPNATLQMDLELVSWKTVVEVTDDKKVIKKILKDGEGYERPNEGAVVKLKLIGKLQDGTVFLKKGHGEDEEPFEFKTDEEQVIEGLEKAVMGMKKGEVALITISPDYAFGSTESKQELAVIPPDSTVCYEVELVSFIKEKESWDMNTQEKIEAAGKKKEEGNTLFKAGKYARASKRYERGVKYIEYDSSFDEEEKKKAKALKIACNLNNAACKLKLKEYKEAAKLSTKVLEMDGSNVKAMYRRAHAYMETADLDLAELDIKKALEIDPDNKEVKIEYKKLKEKVKEYNKKDAKFYSNMLAKMLEPHKEARKDAQAMSIDAKA
ncbi:hypothetical protein Bca4012_014066 [Brassica carinata]